MCEAISIPPRAASDEPTINVSDITLSTSIPTRRAIFLSCAVALIALPILVNFMKKVSRTIITALLRMITSSAELIICDTGFKNSNSGISAGKGRKSDVCARST